MLFKVTTSPAPPQPKVLDTEFKTFYPAINRNTDWCTIKPFVQQAEDLEIVPAIGQAFYDVLHAEYDSTGTIANAVKAQTFRFLRTALAYYAMYIGLPQLNLRTGDAGTNEASASDVMPVRQWVFNVNRWETLKTAAKYLDMALAHAEGQVYADNADYAAFKNSTAFTISQELLIPNARVFQRFYNINTSRRAYTKIRPFIEKAEKMWLLPSLGPLFDLVKTEHAAANLSAANTALLPYLQQLLAERTMTVAMPDINIVNDGEGWQILENTAMASMAGNLKESMQQLHTAAEQNAAQYEIQLKNFLYANLADYPVFRDSPYNELTEDENEDGIADVDLPSPPEPGAVIL